MLIYDEKVAEYLKTNSVVKKFVEDLDAFLEIDRSANFSNLPQRFLKIELGNKFIKIWCDTYCWGFISRVDDHIKGSPIKRGDLLKPASHKAPAKHARGNIIDGTAKYGVYGPEYLK